MSLGLYDYTDLFEAKPILGPIFFGGMQRFREALHARLGGSDKATDP